MDGSCLYKEIVQTYEISAEMNEKYVEILTVPLPLKYPKMPQHKSDLSVKIIWTNIFTQNKLSDTKRKGR